MSRAAPKSEKPAKKAASKGVSFRDDFGDPCAGTEKRDSDLAFLLVNRPSIQKLMRAPRQKHHGGFVVYRVTAAIPQDLFEARCPPVNDPDFVAVRVSEINYDMYTQDVKTKVFVLVMKCSLARGLAWVTDQEAKRLPKRPGARAIWGEIFHLPEDAEPLLALEAAKAAASSELEGW